MEKITNIAFVANGNKCAFFDLIGKEIIKNKSNINIFWICISNHQYEYLLSNGHLASNLLLINWDYRYFSSTPVGEYKLHELVSGDRKLKYRFDDGLSYLINIQKPFLDFVTNNDIKFIFGEITWAHEILMSRICLDKFDGQCFYLHPQSIRIPNGRFTFLDTEFQNSISPIAKNIQQEEVLNDFHIPIVPEVPQRVADVAADVRKTLNLGYVFKRLVNFLVFNRLGRDFISDSPQSMLVPFKIRISNFIKEIYNKFYYTRLLNKITLDDLDGKHFFLVTLHLQPEASVDVVGRYYEDQLLMIKNIWRILPNHYFLVVKEHTNAIGNRGACFFKECLSLRNVLIIDENEKSHDLLNRAEAVFSNSGTIALESALFKKDAFIFSEIFFDQLSYCHKISLEDLKLSSNYFELLKKCRERDVKKMDVVSYSKYIIRSSFEGVVDPHTGSYLFQDKNNINTVVNSFLFFLGRYL